MGVTHIGIAKLKSLISQNEIKSVIELGAQQEYTAGSHYGRYMSEWYYENGVRYESIDLNGENESYKIDLAKPLVAHEKYDLVTDFGTSEHVSEMQLDYDTAVFSWEAIYNCWKTKFDLCKEGGWIMSENPKTGNWPGHGVTYYTQQFYIDLANNSSLNIFALDEIAAMGNIKDGWNIFCTMRKVQDDFPTLEQFMKFDLRRA